MRYAYGYVPVPDGLGDELLARVAVGLPRAESIAAVGVAKKRTVLAVREEAAVGGGEGAFCRARLWQCRSTTWQRDSRNRT